MHLPQSTPKLIVVIGQKTSPDHPTIQKKTQKKEWIIHNNISTYTQAIVGTTQKEKKYAQSHGVKFIKLDNNFIELDKPNEETAPAYYPKPLNNLVLNTHPTPKPKEEITKVSTKKKPSRNI